jgi:hypothetical protein
MGEAIQKTDNYVLIDKYAKKTAQLLGVTPEAVLSEFKKIPSAKVSVSKIKEEFYNAGELEIARPSVHEFYLLKLLLLHEELMPWVTLHLDANWISHPHVRQIVSLRLAAQEHETWHNLAEFLDSCESAEQRSLVTETAAEDRKIPNPETQLADVTLKLRNQFLDQRLGELMQKIGRPETSDAQKIEFLHEQQQLKRQKRLPLTALRK